MKNVYDSSIVGTASKGRLLASSPLTKQPHTRTYRIVLLSYTDGFSVHTEFFPPIQDGILEYVSELESGDYFQAKDLVKATKCFAERLKSLADCLASVYP